jgi:hypothetical protein
VRGGGGDHGKNTILEAYLWYYNAYFAVFVKEKWKNKIPKGVTVGESPTDGFATDLATQKKNADP